MPAEECITGSDAAGRAKSVSSEKQIEDNLSRNKGRVGRSLKIRGTSKGSVWSELIQNFTYREQGQDGKEKVVPLVEPLIQIKLPYICVL